VGDPLLDDRRQILIPWLGLEQRRIFPPPVAKLAVETMKGLYLPETSILFKEEKQFLRKFTK
jgi:hypothetical protein